MGSLFVILKTLAPYILGPIALVAFYGYAHYEGVVSRQGEVDALRSKNTALVADVAAQKLAWQKRVADLVVDLNKSSDTESASLRAQLATVASERDAARAGLRSADQARRAALKPADTAPAPCRTFAASADQLSVPDAEFLTSLAAEADAIAVKLNSCVVLYNQVREALNGQH